MRNTKQCMWGSKHTKQANKIIYDIYDKALANWHTINEKVKKLQPVGHWVLGLFRKNKRSWVQTMTGPDFLTLLFNVRHLAMECLICCTISSWQRCQRTFNPDAKLIHNLICDALQQNREHDAHAYFEIWTIEFGTGVKNNSPVNFEIFYFILFSFIYLFIFFLHTLICFLSPPCNFYLIFKHSLTKKFCVFCSLSYAKL